MPENIKPEDVTIAQAVELLASKNTDSTKAKTKAKTISKAKAKPAKEVDAPAAKPAAKTAAKVAQPKAKVTVAQPTVVEPAKARTVEKPKSKSVMVIAKPNKPKPLGVGAAPATKELKEKTVSHAKKPTKAQPARLNKR